MDILGQQTAIVAPSLTIEALKEANHLAATTEIDLTLLDWFLCLSPLERLEMNDNAARELDELRRAAAASLPETEVP